MKNIAINISSAFAIILLSKCGQSNLEDIIPEKEYNIKIEKVDFERGILILNDKYCLKDIEVIKGMENSVPIDDAIWRAQKPEPLLSMISAPYQLIKKKNNDSIYIISYRDTIITKLIKNE